MGGDWLSGLLLEVLILNHINEYKCIYTDYMNVCWSELELQSGGIRFGSTRRREQSAARPT